MIGIMLICIVFLSQYGLESGFISAQISTWYVFGTFHTICCLEESSFDAKRWIKLFVARSQKKPFQGHLTKPLTIQHTEHLNSWKKANCILYTVCYLAT
jgi:hypothetical protein